MHDCLGLNSEDFATHKHKLFTHVHYDVSIVVLSTENDFLATVATYDKEFKTRKTFNRV